MAVILVDAFLGEDSGSLLAIFVLLEGGDEGIEEHNRFVLDYGEHFRLFCFEIIICFLLIA